MMLLLRFLLGLLAVEGVFSYHGQSFDECPTFDDQGSPPNVNDVNPEPRFEITVREIENGYTPNGTYDLRIKANNPFRSFTRFIVAFENLDKTCKNVALVPLFDNIRYLKECKGVMVSDTPVKMTKAMFQWKAPSCGCLIFKAKVFEGSSEQPTTLKPVTVCPDMLDLDDYLNDLLVEFSPEVAEDNQDDEDISSEEDEYSREEFDDNIVDYPDRDAAVKNPKGLCREFKISRSDMSFSTRRRWWRCCKKTGAGIRRCISKTVPPRERINLRMSSVCRAIDFNRVTSTVLNVRKCCNLRKASKRARCFRKDKFQNIDDYCEGQIRIPFSFRRSESLLSSAELSSCCSSKGGHRYSCFNQNYGGSSKNTKPEVSGQNAASSLCDKVDENGESLPEFKYCCNKLNVHDKVACIGKLVRADFDAKCDSSTDGNSDLFQVVRSKSVGEAWMLFENATQWEVTISGCCMKDTDEERYLCLARKRKNIRIILHVTRNNNFQDNDNTSVSVKVSEDLAPEVYSGDLAPEVYSEDLAPEVYSGDLAAEVYSEDLAAEVYSEDLALEVYSEDLAPLFGNQSRHSPTRRIIEQSKNATACHRKSVRKIRHKLRVLNRICNKPQSRTAGRPAINYMRRCCDEKPKSRLACLRFEEEQRFSDICRGETTPLSLRLGVDRNNPCCQKVHSERSCCFEANSQQQYLGRRPPMLVDLLHLKSDPRGMRELRRMDTLCQDVAEKSEEEMWGRHNVFKCCKKDGNLMHLCLLQVFSTYTDKACSGKKMSITYEIGKFGEIPPSVQKDFLSPSHTCCQFEGRERYQCVSDRGFDRGDVVDESGSGEQEQVEKEITGEIESGVQQRNCERVNSFQSENLFEVLSFVQVVRSFVEQYDNTDEGEEFDDELNDEFDASLEKDRRRGDEVTKGKSFDDETEHLEQEKKGGQMKSRGRNRYKTSDRSKEIGNKGAGKRRRPSYRGRGRKRQDSDEDPTEVVVQAVNQTLVPLHRDEDLRVRRRPQNKGRGQKYPDSREGPRRGNQTRPLRDNQRRENVDEPMRRRPDNGRRGEQRPKSDGNHHRRGNRGNRGDSSAEERSPQKASGMLDHGSKRDEKWHKERDHGVENKTHWHGKHSDKDPVLESASVALKKVSYCCEHTGSTFGKCLKDVQKALLLSLCTLDLDQHNFTSSENSKLSHCCPLKGKRRFECFEGEAESLFEEVGDEYLLVPDGATPNNSFEAKPRNKEFDESESGGRMKRDAGWWTSGLLDTTDSNAGEWVSVQHTRLRSHGMDGKRKLRGLWNDRHVESLCMRIINEEAIGAFGDYREAREENMDHFEGLSGKPRDPVSDGDYVTIIESLRECCVIGDNRQLMRCVRRIRRRAVDQKCAEITIHGRSRSELRRNAPFPKSCCNLKGQERYNCVSQKPRPGHRKDVTDPKDGLFASYERRDSTERESSSPNSGPTHNFILPRI